MRLIASKVTSAIPSLPSSHAFNDSRNLAPKNYGNLEMRKVGKLWNSVKGNGNTSVELDVPFPRDYSELLEQSLHRKLIFFSLVVAMDASGSSTRFVPISFSHSISSKLDHNNFLVWRRQVLAAVRGHRLQDFLSDPARSPPRFLSPEDELLRVINPAFLEWEQQDQLLVSWMLASMSDSILARMVNCETAAQARKATSLALKDNRQLMEIEFPTAGLQSVPGDGEGGIEMTESMVLIRDFCDRFIDSEKATRTRILFCNLMKNFPWNYQFFPEANEVTFARNSAFGGASFKLDYLTKPSFFEDFGFVEKVKMKDRVKPEDELFLIAYPYFNVNEMLVVEELYKEAVTNTTRKLIIFNGELDRIRSGYYPPFFYPKLAALSKTLFPLMETVYYIHNFKGAKGGTLFRSYPGPWKVLRKVRNKYICLHQQQTMPSLKEVALNILPSA